MTESEMVYITEKVWGKMSESLEVLLLLHCLIISLLHQFRDIRIGNHKHQHCGHALYNKDKREFQLGLKLTSDTGK